MQSCLWFVRDHNNLALYRLKLGYELGLPSPEPRYLSCKRRDKAIARVLDLDIDGYL